MAYPDKSQPHFNYTFALPVGGQLGNDFDNLKLASDETIDFLIGSFTPEGVLFFEKLPGGAWLTGIGAPDNSLGKNYDLYLNESNGNVYRKLANVWGPPISNITGPPGPTTPLPDTGTPGIYGDSTHVPQITTDAQGRVTDVELIEIAGGGGGGDVTSVNGETGDVILAKADVGLGNVDNTADASKPVSTAQATADSAVASTAASALSAAISGLTKSSVGLGNVDNTADASKPVSTLQAAADTAAIASAASAAAALYQPASAKDASGGYAGLTLLKINFWNTAATFLSFFVNAATAARTYTFPDKSGTVAMTSDITGTNSGTNTGDQTLPTLVSLGAQATSGKDATGGYAGLTLFKINFKNAANTFTNFFTNATTAARTYTFPDKDLTVAGIVDLPAVAVAADVRTGTDNAKIVTASALFAGMAPVALTPGTTVPVDLSSGINFTLAPVQNFTLSNPTNTKAGQSGRIFITQDGTGSRVLSVGTQYVFMGGLKILSTAAGAVDCINYFVVDATHIRCELALAYA